MKHSKTLTESWLFAAELLGELVSQIQKKIPFELLLHWILNWTFPWIKPWAPSFTADLADHYIAGKKQHVENNILRDTSIEFVGKVGVGIQVVVVEIVVDWRFHCNVAYFKQRKSRKLC